MFGNDMRYVEVRVKIINEVNYLLLFGFEVEILWFINFDIL